jgi:hypothetical protein
MRRGRGCSVGLLRAAAIYFLNLLLATIVTGVVRHPFMYFEVQSDPYFMLAREYILSALAGFGVGFSIYWTWRQKASKWVWAAGLLWFAYRAISLWTEQRGTPFGNPHGLLSQISGSNCSYTSVQSCLDAVNSSVPLVRTVFYSLGALCASPVPKFHFDALKRVFPGLFSMIGEKDNPD